MAAFFSELFHRSDIYPLSSDYTFSLQVPGYPGYHPSLWTVEKYDQCHTSDYPTIPPVQLFHRNTCIFLFAYNTNTACLFSFPHRNVFQSHLSSLFLPLYIFYRVPAVSFFLKRFFPDRFFLLPFL